MLERRAGADQSAGSKLRETDVGRTEGKKNKGKEERRLESSGEERKNGGKCVREEELGKERKERSRENSEEEETTEKKSKPLAPRARRWWKMVKTDSRKCELGLQGDEDGLVKRVAQREEQGLIVQTEPQPKGTGANTQPDRDRGAFVV